MCYGMISPNRLAEESNAADGRGTCASLRAVEPAVRSPSQAVCHGMGILQTETFEVDLRRAVGHIIAIPVGIKEQVRRVHDPNSAASRQRAGRDIQAGDKIVAGLEV